MRLPPPLIETISHGLLRSLVEGGVITTDHLPKTRERVARVITSDLSVEDDIAEEARLLLLDHQAEINNADIQYHLLMAKAKGQIASKRGYLLSRGPDKLSLEKQHDLARLIVELFLRDDDVEYYVEDSELHIAVRRALERELLKDARREERARDKVRNIKRRIPEESQEFHTLFRQFYKELLDREG